MSKAAMEYYQDYPLDRIKRGINGLQALVHLMEILDSSSDAVCHVHELADIIADDLAEAERTMRAKITDT